MHHLPLGTRLHRNISKGGGKRPGDGCAGFLSKMGVTIFTGTQVVWDGKRYVAPATQIELQKFAPCIVVCIYIKSRSRVWHVSLYMFMTTHTRTTHTHSILRRQWHQSVDQPLRILFVQRLRCGCQRLRFGFEIGFVGQYVWLLDSLQQEVYSYTRIHSLLIKQCSHSVEPRDLTCPFKQSNLSSWSYPIPEFSAKICT